MSVTAARGFVAGGTAAGIKAGGLLDLAVVAAARPVPTAGVFTTNRAAAAPVRLSRRHLESGTAQAIVINSGCANAATGAAGDAAALAMASAVGAHLGIGAGDVLVGSTGTIGTTLPMPSVLSGITALIPLLRDDRTGGADAARAIMTTDTVPKEAAASAGGFTVGGMVKGAGMIRPDMATMIGVITTDAVVESPVLDRSLREAVDRSFHAINVDGCASTNDTVVVMASGASGVRADAATLTPVLSAVAADLAALLVADAEGASRVVTLRIRGAVDDATARRAGRAIADSALVRAAFYGGDPNWGRIVGALGASAIEFDPSQVAVGFAGVPVAEAGVEVEHPRRALFDRLAEGDFVVDVTIGAGPGLADVFTTDLTPEYVLFNGERS